MHTTYHFKSAEDINIDVLNAIKKEYKNNAVVLTIKEEPVFSIPESQKKFVRASIEKYNSNTELLINEDDSWKMINAD